MQEMVLDASATNDITEEAFARTPYDDYDELRVKLVDLIPSFDMRPKFNPRTSRYVFANAVHSIFDICWYTFARMIVDDAPPEKKPEEPTGGETVGENPVPPDAVPGTDVPVTEQPPASGSAVDLPAQAEDAIGTLPEQPAAEQPEQPQNELPVLLIAAALALICCVVFVRRKTKNQK